MELYQQQISKELRTWQKKMQRDAMLPGKLAKRLQDKINGVIPEKVHRVITAAIKQMTRAVLTGAGFSCPAPVDEPDLLLLETRVREKIDFYKTTAATEGAITGAGGILLGLADFPLFLGLKIKMLFDIAALYGYDMRDYKERLFILYIFQITFSSQQLRNKTYPVIAHWDTYSQALPEDIDSFDWRNFQQEYRDYIDLAKLLQLMPGIGAVVGAVVNHRLTDQLGKSAMNAYRMRRFAAKQIIT
ncbi:EcsC family protein [Chitinophaga pendula]|uniref:EcsC family protein n=1 Tax=Chitinophaga TaxID=79328 RepID=UPI000BB0C577|nr:MULTISPECIES: EcsC family protein [Chitinophaga]ASZ14321.1 ABC transporter-associated protein EcsC [Chitinophaga sp. MD30]UCJ08029.1 EcsC family protein [Chitinophaga pendula]